MVDAGHCKEIQQQESLISIWAINQRKFFRCPILNGIHQSVVRISDLYRNGRSLLRFLLILSWRFVLTSILRFKTTYVSLSFDGIEDKKKKKTGAAKMSDIAFTISREVTKNELMLFQNFHLLLPPQGALRKYLTYHQLHFTRHLIKYTNGTSINNSLTSQTKN